MTTDTTTTTPEIPEGRSMAPIAEVPPSDMLMSLNGFDEIAIAAQFGVKVPELRQSDAITFGRALAFVHYRRAGMKDPAAHEAAMLLTMREVSEFFPPEADDEADEADASAEGNGE